MLWNWARSRLRYEAVRCSYSWFLTTTHSVAIAAAVSLSGCATHNENIALAAVGVTALGARAPTHEVEVIYYLGVFDPQDQLPPTVYRIRVHGQSSFISRAKFASGWVRAELIDSLSTGGRFEGNGLTVDPANSLAAARLQVGRRLIMFGPEGFREAPRDHRLVVVMGSDPSGFFAAMDKSLGAVAAAQSESQNSGLVEKLFAALTQLQEQSVQLGELAKSAAGTFPGSQ
jgi:hypothetical protein